MTVNQLIDALTRMVAHRQIDGNSEVKFANNYSEWQINGLYCSQINDTVCLTYRKAENERGVYTSDNKKR